MVQHLAVLGFTISNGTEHKGAKELYIKDPGATNYILSA
jgi:hypothetical protein